MFSLVLCCFMSPFRTKSGAARDTSSQCRSFTFRFSPFISYSSQLYKLRYYNIQMSLNPISSRCLTSRSDIAVKRVPVESQFVSRPLPCLPVCFHSCTHPLKPFSITARTKSSGELRQRYRIHQVLRTLLVCQKGKIYILHTWLY